MRSRPTLVHTALKRLGAVIALTASTLIAGCGNEQPTGDALNSPSAITTPENADVVNGEGEVDLQAWKSELVAFPGVLANPDMDAIYRITVDECNDPVDQLALQFTMAGANPDITRVGFKYVCPQRVSHVDQAVLQNQQTKDELTNICRTPPGQRTDNQKLLIEAEGPEACADR